MNLNSETEMPRNLVKIIPKNTYDIYKPPEISCFLLNYRSSDHSLRTTDYDKFTLL